MPLSELSRATVKNCKRPLKKFTEQSTQFLRRSTTILQNLQIGLVSEKLGALPSSPTNDEAVQLFVQGGWGHSSLRCSTTMFQTLWIELDRQWYAPHHRLAMMYMYLVYSKITVLKQEGSAPFSRRSTLKMQNPNRARTHHQLVMMSDGDVRRTTEVTLFPCQGCNRTKRVFPFRQSP